MTVVTGDLLSGITTVFRALFSQSFAAAANQQIFLNSLALRVPSDGEQNTYTWFGTVPIMQDVTHGTVTFEGLNRYSFTIQNLEWQNGIEVERAAIERDRLNLIRPRIGQLAQEAARHPAQLLLNLFETPGNAFDGTAFFANTRTIGDSANIDNILTGTGLDTVAHFQADLAAARAQMRNFQDDKGRPMNLIGNTIVVPAGGEQLVWQALNTNQGDAVNTPTMPADFGNGTILSGYQVFVNPYLTDANDWYLLHQMGEERPFVFQEETPVEFFGAEDVNTRDFITFRSFPYSAYGRYNVGVTDPRFAVKTTNT